MENYVNSVFAGVEENLAAVFSRTTMTMLNIATYYPIYSAVVDTQQSFEEKERSVRENIADMLADEEYVEAVDIVLDSGETFRYSAESVSELMKMDMSFVRMVTQGNLSIYGNSFYDINGNDYLCAAIRYNNYKQMSDPGCIIVYINKAKLKSTYCAYSNKNIEMFVTIGNTVLLGDNVLSRNRLYMPVEPSENYSFYTYQPKIAPTYGDIRLNMITRNDELHMLSNRLYLFIFLLMIITGILAVAGSVLISGRLTRSIGRLLNEIDAFSETGHGMIKIENENEIAALEEHFNRMAEEIQGLIEKNDIENEEKRIAELNALQSQINPHFIYNAIDSIKWLAELERPYSMIEEISYALASFFRISLHKGDNVIKVSEELEHVRCYLAIEKIRFANLFTESFDVEPEMLDKPILKILLQPLVENSLRHGFRNMKSGGKIEITGRMEQGDYMIFKVKDNGIGFECQNGEVPHSESGGGYGLYNIDERIRLAYGDSSMLSVESAVGKGTTVTISIKVKGENI